MPIALKQTRHGRPHRRFIDHPLFLALIALAAAVVLKLLGAGLASVLGPTLAVTGSA